MTGIKADLHVHSKFSKRPSSWVLQKIGCQESYTSPIEVYNTAKKRGMDYVTITDHNLIDGALEIAHLDDTFISEEITTYFPEDGCKIHILAWDITEENHQEISLLRENIFDLVPYLNKNNIPHGVAHPLYSINDRLNMDHFEQLLIMFANFELNGTRDFYQNQVLSKILYTLTPELLDRLQNKHNLKSPYEKPWIKQITGGSDDHSSLNIASKYTNISGVDNLTEYLEVLRQKRLNPHVKTDGKGEDASPLTMAHNLYSIVYQFYKTKIPINKYIEKDPALGFIDEILTTSKPKPQGFISSGIKYYFFKKKAKKEFNQKNASFEKVLFREARQMLLEDSKLAETKAFKLSSNKKSDILYQYIERISNRVLRRFADQSFTRLSKGNIFDIFHILGSAGSLYAMLSPYFLGYGLFTKDRAFCDKCKDEFLKKPEDYKESLPSVAYFTDTFEQINGVAKTLQKQLEISKKMSLKMEILTCGESEIKNKNAVYFDPVGKFEIPEYEGLKIYYPPFLRMLDHCYSGNFSHIHAVTPGPVGLAALAVSKILNKPLYGTYHTAFPEYVKAMTNDSSLEELAWKYMVWFYNQMDAVYTPSKAIGKELIERGIDKEKIVFYPRGIDTEKFDPSKKDIMVEYKYKIPSNRKRLLYVGRVSKEKNLEDLVHIFKKVCGKRTDYHLIIAGDGPYLKQMKKELKNYPVTFTGFVNGEELSAIYASADLFVFPSTTDTFGNVVLEAQASGVPVVVTDKGGPMENLIPGKTGNIVNAHDIDAFSRSILDILDDPSILEKMKKDARKYMETRSFDSAHKELWRLYDEYTPDKNAA